MQVPFQNNATCNRSCVYKLVDNAYFNLEDSYIARARPAYITTDESLAKVRPRIQHADVTLLCLVVVRAFCMTAFSHSCSMLGLRMTCSCLTVDDAHLDQHVILLPSCSVLQKTLSEFFLLIKVLAYMCKKLAGKGSQSPERDVPKESTVSGERYPALPSIHAPSCP